MADEVVGDGQPGGDGTPAPSKPAGDPNGTSNPNPNPSPAPAPGNKGGDDAERRFKGIQADLAKERRERQQLQAQLTQHQADLAAERRRVQALAGVNPADPKTAEDDAIRARLNQLRPDLADLTKEEIAEWRAMAADRKQLSETTQHYWASHGKAMIGAVEKEIANTFGDLNPRQRDAVAKAYVLKAQADPEFLARHEQGDPELAKEFAKEWVEDWFEPARRKATAAEVGRFRPAPGGKDRSILTQGDKKIDVNDPKAVEDFLVQGFKERGGQFGHR